MKHNSNSSTGLQGSSEWLLFQSYFLPPSHTHKMYIHPQKLLTSFPRTSPCFQISVPLYMLFPSVPDSYLLLKSLLPPLRRLPWLTLCSSGSSHSLAGTSLLMTLPRKCYFSYLSLQFIVPMRFQHKNWILLIFEALALRTYNTR